jgi:serine/threonine protein kinase
MYKSIRAEDPRYADSIVGSPDYMAPEVLRGKPYTYSVDYWSLGCIFFEFLAGFPPFSGGTPEETWTNLKNWTKVLRRPEYDKPEDLIFNLTDIAWDAVTRYRTCKRVLSDNAERFLFPVQAHLALKRSILHSYPGHKPPFL